MQKAVAYIRVSDQRQADDGSSLVTQQKLVVTHAASRGYSVVKVFREEGESAKTDQRPKLQQLIEYCQANKGKIDVLLIPKIDRLARNVHDYSNLKLKFSKYGVRIESVGERIEDNPVGRFTESILASVAQFDNEVRAERCKGGMVEAVAQGRWVWKAPLGYRNIRHEGKGTIEPDPVTGPIVREAFYLIARGHMNPLRVHQWMQETGLKMSRATFYTLVENPIYVGQIRAFGRTFSAKPPFVPLVSEETFYKAKHALRPRLAQNPKQQLAQDFALRGVVRCECGRLLTAAWSAGKRQKYPYYRCMHCSNVNHRMEELDRGFNDFIAYYKTDAGLWDQIAPRLRKVAIKREEFAKAELSRRDDEIGRLKELQKKLALKVAMDVIPDDVGKSQIEELNGQIAELYANQDLNETISIEGLIEHSREFFSNIDVIWSRADSEAKQQIVSYLMPEGVVYTKTQTVRTPQNPFLDSVKSVFSGNVSELVDHDAEFTNTVLSWLTQIPKGFMESR